MRSRRRNQDDILKDIYEVLVEVPVWVGPIFVCVVFSFFRWFVPWIIGEPAADDVMGKTFAAILSPLSKSIAPWAAGLFGLIWLAAELRKWLNRRRFDRHTGLDRIRELNWREFELLLSEAFRRKGYSVEHVGDSGPDGGIDLRLFKSGETTLVQCKHWRHDQVGVKIVRELLGVVTSEKASGGIVVTSGDFTEDAKAFARNNPVKLIGRDMLVPLICSVQAGANQVPLNSSTTATPEPPLCPRCGAAMLVKTARKGPNPGSQFWGCSRYPDCRGTKSI